MPPSSGPLQGVRPSTDTETNSYCTPSEVNSRPFDDTSTDAYPTSPRVELHTSDESLTFDATDVDVPLKRHQCSWHANRGDTRPEPPITDDADEADEADEADDADDADDAGAPGGDGQKPLPNTVTETPPEDAPRDGQTDETAADARYVNETPLPLNC